MSEVYMTCRFVAKETSEEGSVSIYRRQLRKPMGLKIHLGYESVVDPHEIDLGVLSTILAKVFY
jgi:hypothetical protein